MKTLKPLKNCSIQGYGFKRFFVMTPYIQKALETYCDTSQTYIAREIAYNILRNAGFRHSDIQHVLKTGAQSLSVYLFAA